MPFSLGFWAAAGAGGGADAGAYELISTTILSSTTATVSFSSIPSSYKHLQIRITGRMSSGAANGSIMTLNSDTGSNYAYHNLTADSSTVTGGNATSQTSLYPYQFIGSSGADFDFGVAVIDILDYANTSKNKTIRALSGFSDNAAHRINFRSGVWLSTSAISSMQFSGFVSYVAGSRFSLYGIKG